MTGNVFLMKGWDGVVVIATGYIVNFPGILSWWERDFPYPSRLAQEPTQPLII
jgi:hypothetical protein